MLFGAALDPELPVSETARRLEELGFDYAAVGEHVFFHSPTTNAFVALGVAAGATRTISLVSTVTLSPLYPAPLAAKMAAELRRLSGERFELGVGMGGEFPGEFLACGVDRAERASRLEESLEVIRLLMAGRAVTFEGRYSRLTDLTLMPAPKTPLPIWVGGRHENAMRRAARWADVWMPYLFTPEQFALSMDVIRGAADDGQRCRPPVEGALFAWTVLGEDTPKAVEEAATGLSAIYGQDMRSAARRYVLAGSVEHCLARLAEYQASGVTRCIFSPVAPSGNDRQRMIERIAHELLPRCRETFASPQGES
jgi:alkanesulfonate monooxygenase SsuD/methylene tetrahydromethanopterin reductase-like flavin-dependent oxidoreductase (luciferase family)